MDTYNKCSHKVCDNETHDDIDDNLMRPFWSHAQIEEKDAYFNETVGDQYTKVQRSFGEQYPKETVINNTKM